MTTKVCPKCNGILGRVSGKWEHQSYISQVNCRASYAAPIVPDDSTTNPAMWPDED